MGAIALVANPNSGKDIRRLVTHATVIDNAEKVNILRRILSGIAYLGGHDVYLMPDRYQLGRRTLQGVEAAAARRAKVYDMPITDTQDDTTRFVRAMVEEVKVDAVVVLGGDGTSRAAAKAIGDVPMIPVSTGTNNVYPAMQEGTAISMAAAAIAGGRVSRDECGARGKRIEIEVGTDKRDIALIDAVFSTLPYTGAKALLHQEDIDSILVTQCHPASIGFSALAGCVRMVSPQAQEGFFLKPDWSGRQYAAAISAGMFVRFSAQQSYPVALNETLTLQKSYDGTIAVDGERELTFRAGEDITLTIKRQGPRKVDVLKTVELAASRGYLGGET